MKFFILIFLIFSNLIFTKEITLSAAVSLKEFLEKNIEEYKKIEPDLNILLNLGSSGVLKKQIEQGAPIDIIFLANEKYMLDLEEKNLIKEKFNLLKNRLVLIKNSTTINNNFLSIGNPKVVPVGMYALELLEKVNLNFDYELLYSKDARAVLNYVELGESKYGIIYKSDSKLLSNSKVIKTFDESLYSPIVYPIGISTNSENQIEANKFIEFLKGRDWND